MAPFEDGFDLSQIFGSIIGAGAVVGVTTFAIATVGRAASMTGGGSTFPKSIGKLEKAWIFYMSGKLFSDLTGEDQSKYRTDFAGMFRTPGGKMKKGATARLKAQGYNRKGGF